jgi:hypothetical protein
MNACRKGRAVGLKLGNEPPSLAVPILGEKPIRRD